MAPIKPLHDRLREEISEALGELPACFETVKPLALGIRKDIAEKYPRVSGKRIRRLLGVWCSSPLYLQKCKSGAHRLTLDGRYAGRVTHDEAIFARVRALRAKMRKGEKPRKRRPLLILKSSAQTCV